MYEEAIKLWRSAVLILDGDDSGMQQLLGKDLISDEFKGPQFIQNTLNHIGKVGVSDSDAIDSGQSSSKSSLILRFWIRCQSIPSSAPSLTSLADITATRRLLSSSISVNDYHTTAKTG